MLAYFTTTKRGILSALEAVLAAHGARYAGISEDLGADAAAKLAAFTARGKLLRGGLVKLGYELASGEEARGKAAESVYLAGAAMELFQSGLLVHDDIMDRDRTRRGAPTLHVEYEEALRRGGYDDPRHYGEALGICLGDLAYFAAFHTLATLPLPDAAARAACLTAASELAMVGVAQMQDVANGAAGPAASNPFREAPVEPSEEDILRLYRYKTGRYTFSLPLSLGAAIAGSPAGLRARLEDAGESLGVLFQLKDDELGLFADERELGKPVGGDVREDKKTLYRLRLLERSGPERLARLRTVFGNREASRADLGEVTAAMEASGVRAELSAMMASRARDAASKLEDLSAAAPAEAAAAWSELLAYSLERRS